MNASLTQVTKLMTRRSRSGQSIIIIAFAFIALIAFVGIATDVAMLFVRFGALRRAVDAASIAAAGQVRENADYFTMQSIAEQFIKVHGIDPTTVKVETCETEISDYIAGTTHAAAIAAYKAQPGHSGATDADAARGILIQGPPKSDLCKDTPQKLVRVSAQIQSPTSFLSVLGWKAVTLSTSSVSQTASLDVALLLDTSLSETQDTFNAMADTSYYKVGTPNSSGGTYFDLNDYPTGPGTNNFAKGDIGKAYTAIAGTCGSVSSVAPYNAAPYLKNCNNADSLRSFRDFTNPSPTTTAQANTWAQNSLYTSKAPAGRWGVGLNPAPPSYVVAPAPATPAYTLADHDANGTKVIRYECWYYPRISPSQPSAANYSWAGCCNDPTIQSDATGVSTFNPFLKTGYNTDPSWYVYDDGKLPESIIMTSGTFDGNPKAQVLAGGTNWSTGSHFGDAGGVNAYNGHLGPVYPFNRGDGNYSDLICRPFKDVRDAARRFLRRLDFVRGDRVLLVTFDSSAKVIQPYGSNIQIITDESTAVRALNMQVGVEVNPGHIGAGCQQFNSTAVGPTGDPVDWMGNNATSQVSSYYNGVNPGGVNASPVTPRVSNYWTIAQCPDTNMGDGILLGSNSLVDPQWIRRDSVWVMVVLSDGYPNRTPSLSLENVGPYAQENSTFTGTKPGTPKSITDNTVKQYCNSDPVLATNPFAASFGLEPQACAAAPSPALPAGSTFRMSWGLRNNDPLDPSYTQLKDFPVSGSASDQASYYSFGFCPRWTFAINNQEDANSTYWPWATNVSGTTNPVPWCADNDPNSRHFCMTPGGDINPDPTVLPAPDAYKCDKNYDAMDYAMDMTDFAALKDYTATGQGNFIAMYSIFFAHNPLTEDNLALGVKMGRYIADAGDNGEIDNPIQRWYRDARDTSVNPPPIGSNCPFSATACDADVYHNTIGATQFLPHDHPANDTPFWSAAPYGYTTADACIDQDTYTTNVPASAATHWLIPATDPAYHANLQQSCGQFFYAADITAVNQAFTEIAGRLFTRLSR